MSTFRIQIERLSDRPERFVFEVEPAWWATRAQAEGDDVRVERPFCFSLRASRVSEDVVIEGELEGEVGLECSRCGKRYSHALREPYRIVLEPLQDGRAPDPEGEKGLAENGVCLGEDLEVGAYRGAVVGLDDFFGEVIALAMPIQPLCDEDCPGLCAHCGVARDVGCDCEDEKIESPFSALAGLKARLESKAPEEQ